MLCGASICAVSRASRGESSGQSTGNAIRYRGVSRWSDDILIPLTLSFGATLRLAVAGVTRFLRALWTRLNVVPVAATLVSLPEA